MIRDLALELRPHSFLALFGPSGCGKTTLLNLIAGLDRDFDGEVRLPEAARIGYVFQEPRLLPWLTVEANLQLVLADEPARAAGSTPGSPRWVSPMCARCSRPGSRSAWRAGSRSRARSRSGRRCC